jgi:hypothetical protein
MTMVTARAAALRLWLPALCAALVLGEANADLLSKLPRRTTLLQADGFGQAGQALEGYWYADYDDGPQLFRFAAMGGDWVVFHGGSAPRIFADLKTGQRNLIGEDFAGVWGQFKRRGECVSGLSMSVEKRVPGRPPRCPQYLWWDRSQACFAPGGLRDGQLSVHSFRHEPPECVQNTSLPDDRTTRLRRFVGASFAPLPHGRYVHLTAVAAPQGYRAAARIAWDYGALRQVAAPFRIRMDAAAAQGPGYSLGDGIPLSGTRDITSERPGRMRVTISLVSGPGVIHTDVLAVDFPKVPGLN